jgi:chromosome partitioning protein
VQGGPRRDHNGVVVVAAFITEKGGVGKTSVTLGVASAARSAGRRVLVVDADPQASATYVLGASDDAAGRFVSALEAPRPGGAAGCVVPSRWSSVDVLPGARDLREWNPDGGPKVRALKLARALRGLVDEYDAVLVDCPPGLGLLPLNALAAAQRAVMVTELSALSIQAVEPVADLVDDVWHRFNDQLDLAGVVVNRVPARSNAADAQYEELARIVGRRAIWKPPIPQRVIVTEAAAEGRPIHDYGSRAVDVIDAYDRIWRRLSR